MPLGVGLLGCGGMGRVYATCMASLADARLVSIYDIDAERSRSFAGEFGCRSVPSASDVIRDPKVDCVYVCTTHDSHLPLVREVAQIGKPVYCEKPMGIDLAQAIAMHDAVKQSGILFMIGFNHRRNKGNLKAKELVQGRIRPLLINVTFACPHFLEGWMGTAAQGGGILNSLGCHAFDLSCYFAEDEPAEITCLSSRLRVPEPYLDDTASLAIKFRRGAVASISLHDHAPDKYVWEPGQGLLRVEIFGASAAVISTGSRDVTYCVGNEIQHFSVEPYQYHDSWGYRQTVIDFLQAVREQETVTPNEDDGLRAAYLVDAAQRAAVTGQTVRLPLLRL